MVKKTYTINRFYFCWVAAAVIVFYTVMVPDAISADMRTDYKAISMQKEELIKRAQEERRAAEQEAEIMREKILSDKTSLKEAVAELKKRNQHLESSIDGLEKDVAGLKETEQTLTGELAEMDTVVQALNGFIRGNAKDISSLVNQSLQSALIHDRGAMLQPLASDTGFPSMENIRQMADILIKEIQLSGEVRLTTGPIIDRFGREIEADLLILGNFTAIYRTPDEVGFLLYSDNSRRLFALSRLPSRAHRREIKNYMAGTSDVVPIDISKGAALRQLTHELSLVAQIPKGGPIVWPILLIFGLAVVIVIERVWSLYQKRMDIRSFMDTVGRQVRNHQWDACRTLCETNNEKPIPRIIYKALEFKNDTREQMENALQEAILREIPPLERFLSTLGMLAAIAPLLGLLGTVTGMINTFHVITYYGAGDARMMSGGISEALVTTMLGLTVAIPIMLAHTLLTRHVENLISRMEEKAVSFVNMVFKERKHP